MNKLLSTIAALFLLGLSLLDAAVSRHAPDINGLLDGDVYQLEGDSVNMNSGGRVTGTWYLPGTLKGSVQFFRNLKRVSPIFHVFRIGTLKGSVQFFMFLGLCLVPLC